MYAALADAERIVEQASCDLLSKQRVASLRGDSKLNLQVPEN